MHVCVRAPLFLPVHLSWICTLMLDFVPLHAGVLGSISPMTPNRNKEGIETWPPWGRRHVYISSSSLPERGTSSLSLPSPKSLPRLIGLLPSAAPALLPPSSASSTGTTVKVGMLDLYFPVRKYEEVSTDVNGDDTSCWTFTPAGKRKKYIEGVQWEKIEPYQGPSEESWRSRLDHNMALTFLLQICCFLSLCNVIQWALNSVWKCRLRHMGQAKVLQCISLSLLVPFPPFFSPLLEDYCPMWPSIYHMNRAIAHTWRSLQLLPPAWLSYFSHSHLCNATKVDRQNSEVSKGSKVSVKSTLTTT